MNEAKEKADEQPENSYENVPEHLRQFVFKPGVSGNPGGRPKGIKSMKEYAREYLEIMDDDERVKFLNRLNPDFVWKMAEGQPKQATDIEVLGTPIIHIAKEVAEKHDIDTSTSDNSKGQA